MVSRIRCEGGLIRDWSGADLFNGGASTKQSECFTLFYDLV